MLQGEDEKSSELLLREESSDAESVSSVHTAEDESPHEGSSTATSVKVKHHSSSAATSMKGYKKQKMHQQKKAGEDVSAILSQLLEENRKKDAELAVKVTELLPIVMHSVPCFLIRYVLLTFWYRGTIRRSVFFFH